MAFLNYFLASAAVFSGFFAGLWLVLAAPDEIKPSRRYIGWAKILDKWYFSALFGVLFAGIYFFLGRMFVLAACVLFLLNMLIALAHFNRISKKSAMAFEIRRYAWFFVCIPLYFLMLLVYAIL